MVLVNFPPPPHHLPPIRLALEAAIDPSNSLQYLGTDNTHFLCLVTCIRPHSGVRGIPVCTPQWGTRYTGMHPTVGYTVYRYAPYKTRVGCTTNCTKTTFSGLRGLTIKLVSSTRCFFLLGLLRLV